MHNYLKSAKNVFKNTFQMIKTKKSNLGHHNYTKFGDSDLKECNLNNAED
jgi:hypothetical protein